MKKLMIAATAALCGTVVFGLESANVVGFLEKVGTQGYSLFTPTFADVGVDGVDIQNVKLKNAVGSETENIQTFTAAGALNPSYAYLTSAADGMDDGWYDSDWNLVEGETITAGKGFLFWNDSGDATLEFSGEVVKGVQAIPVSLGYSIMGNASPVAVDIQDMKLLNATGSETENIQTFTASGALNPSYSYLTLAADGMDDGWYDADWNLVEETVQPGAAFLIWNDSAAELKLQLPAAY